MKVWRVTGWTQFKTDAATSVDQLQLAESAADAISAVKDPPNPNYTYLLSAKENSQQ